MVMIVLFIVLFQIQTYTFEEGTYSRGMTKFQGCLAVYV